MAKPKLRIIETFSGVSMQKRGVENTGLFEVESIATCDTDANAIISRAAIHDGLTNEMIDNYDYPSREEMVSDLERLHINYDFVKNKDYNWRKKINSKGNDIEKTWLACKVSNNLGDIARVQEFDECDLLFTSFPCTDVSQAGHQKGLQAGETRSGLVWEVIRILKNTKKLPKFILMENVDALVNKKNLPQYEELNKEFEEIGYSVVWDILNAKFCGVPQNRARVFAVYYLKDIDMSKFEFPHRFDNGKRLINVLEENVDEKYYISTKAASDLIDKLIEEGKIDE